MLRWFLCIGLACVGGFVGAYSPVGASAAANLPTVRGEYNFTDISSPIFKPELMHSIETSCKSQFSRKACVKLLDEADKRLRLLFDTSDRDEFDIYRKLFDNSVGSASLGSIFAKTGLRASLLNSTIHGTNAAGEMQPGLLRDIVSISDGINQLRTISAGQKRSVSLARRQQQNSFQAIARNAKSNTALVTSQLDDLIKNLVDTRTLVQTNYFRNMWKSANDTLSDMESQSGDFLRESQEQLYALAKRYYEWSSVTNDEIASSKDRTSSVLIAMNDLIGKMIPNSEAKWTGDHLRIVEASVSDSVKSLSQKLADLLSIIQIKFQTLNSAIVKRLDMSQAEFASNQTVVQSDIDDKLRYLADQLKPDNDGAFVDQLDKETRDTVQSKIQTITDGIKSLVIPIVSDVKTGLKQSEGISSDISNLRSSIVKDTRDVLDSSRAEIVGLKAKFAGDMAETKKTFDDSIESKNAEVTIKIDNKVKTAKSRLDHVFKSIQQLSSNVATGQKLSDMAAQDTAKISATAAELAAAKQKLVSDNVSASLQSGVGIISASLADTSSTADAIFAKNQAGLFSAQTEGNAAKEKLIESAQSQLVTDSRISQAVVSSLSSSLHKSQLASEDMDATISQSGQYLDQTIRTQVAKSSDVSDDASDVMFKAEQGGKALLNQMLGLESVSSQSVAAFLAGLNSKHSGNPQIVLNVPGQSAIDLLSNLSSVLNKQNIPYRPSVPPGLATDQKALSQDVGVGPKVINTEARNGANLIAAKSNQAMLHSVRTLQSTSTDSQTALANLMNYNADLVETKRKLALSSSGSAVNASMEAAEYLADSGTNYMEISDRFLRDVSYLSEKGILNQSIALAGINETLTDITAIADEFTAKLNGTVANATVAFPSGIKQDALGIVSGIKAKLNETLASIVSVTNGSIDTVSILSEAKNLNEYIDSLKNNFEKQRASFNRYAQQVALRRIAALTGLSESVIAQKLNTLQSLAQSDQSEADAASRTTEMLQSLQKAVEEAKTQGDVSKATTLINSIGERVNSFTHTLTNQLDTTSSHLGQQTNASTGSIGQTLGSLAYSAATSAQSFGTNLLNAIATVQQSDLAATVAAQGDQKDVFAIAGMLKKLDIMSQQKIFQLLSQLNSGNITLSDATVAAQNLHAADIQSLYDVLQSITPYIARHESIVNSFRDHLNTSTEAISSNVLNAIRDHEAIDGDLMADIHSVANLLTSLKQSLPGAVDETELDLVGRIGELEKLLESIFFTNNTVVPDQSSDSDGWLNLVLAPSSFSEVSNNTYSRISDLGRLSSSTKGIVENAKKAFVSDIDRDMEAGENVLRQIIATVKSSILIV